MRKTIYLMRHGQTLFNVQHKIQGWCDSPLTDIGIAQAKIAGQYFTNHNINLEYGYCSTSERCSDTLEIVTDNKLDYKRIKGLKEWNFGAFEGKDECLNPPLPYGDFFASYNGEKESEFKDRICSTILDIANNDKHNNILIVSHGAACAQFVRNWQHNGEVKYQRGIKNCAIFHFEYEDGQFYLLEIINHDFTSLGL